MVLSIIALFINIVAGLDFSLDFPPLISYLMESNLYKKIAVNIINKSLQEKIKSTAKN